MRKKKENQLRRLVIADKDLSLAKRFASYLLTHDLLPAKNHDKQLVRLAFQTSLIVTYSRQFLDSRGGSKEIPRILFGRHLRVLNTSEKQLHERIMNMRNSVYAHSDGDEYDMKFEEIEIQDLGVNWVWPMSRNPHAPLEKNEVETFSTILDKLLESVRQHRKELEADLFPKTSS